MPDLSTTAPAVDSTHGQNEPFQHQQRRQLLVRLVAPAAVGAALDVPDGPGQAEDRRLVRLRERPTLLVLDKLRAGAGAATWVTRLLRAAPACVSWSPAGCRCASRVSTSSMCRIGLANPARVRWTPTG